MNIDEDAVNRWAKHEAARTKHVSNHDSGRAMDFNATPHVDSMAGLSPSQIVKRFSEPIPTADGYVVGQRVTATREISPKIPVGTSGRVRRVREDINEIVVEWFHPGQRKPFAKTTGSPSRGITPEEES